MWIRVSSAAIFTMPISPVVGSEQGGVRPVLIIQNDTGNRYSPTVIAAAITSQTGKAKLPTHIDLPVDHSCGLSRDSVVLLEQVRTLDKKAPAGKDGPCGGECDGEGRSGHRGQLRTAPRPDGLRDPFLRQYTGRALRRKPSPGRPEMRGLIEGSS